MPNRILYERICGSQTLADLTAEEEVFFYRLLVQCDDFGRYDARPPILRARCFALQLDRVSEQDISLWLASLERAGLVTVYEVEERRYLQVATWSKYQRTRSSESRYPAPPATGDPMRQQTKSSEPSMRPRSAGLATQQTESSEGEDTQQRSARLGEGDEEPSIEEVPPIAASRGHPRAPDSNGGQMPPETESYSYSNSYADAISGVEEADPHAPDGKRPRAAASAPTPPPELEPFDRVLRTLKGYQPNNDFYELVRSTYGHLNLEKEAIALADYVHRKRYQCTTARVFNWLERVDASPKERTNGTNHRTNGAARRDLRPGESWEDIEALSHHG